jgi:hypothetical protein
MGSKGSIVRRKMNLKQTHQPLRTLHGVRYKARSIANPKGLSSTFQVPSLEAKRFSLYHFCPSPSASNKPIFRSEFGPDSGIAASNLLTAFDQPKLPGIAYWLTADLA